ncbi:MAG: hypothetical protein ACP5HH_07510 [Fervidicoccaceae archaeon]
MACMPLPPSYPWAFRHVWFVGTLIHVHVFTFIHEFQCAFALPMLAFGTYFIVELVWRHVPFFFKAGFTYILMSTFERFLQNFSAFYTPVRVAI